MGIIPEARLNLVLCYCRRGDPARALHLLRGLEPGTAFEHICQVTRGCLVVLLHSALLIYYMQLPPQRISELPQHQVLMRPPCSPLL